MLASLGPRIERAAGVAGSCARRSTRSCSTTVDAALEPDIAALGLRTLVTDTMMADDAGRARLARTVLEFAGSR